MAKSIYKSVETTESKDRRSISITLDGLIGEVFRQLESKIDNAETTQEEQKLVDFLINALPHERVMYILSKFTGVQDYPLYPETINYLLEQGDNLEEKYPGEIFEDGLDFYKEEFKRLELITIKSLNGDSIDLERKPRYRNYYSFPDWDVEDNDEAYLLIGKFPSIQDSSFYEIVKNEELKSFPKSSEYSTLSAHVPFFYRTHDGEDNEPTSIMPIRVPSQIAKQILGKS
jgi:hypothetical protein